MSVIAQLRQVGGQLVQRVMPRNLGHLAGANLLSQVSSLVAMPLLTRWCSITDFGIFQLYATTVTVLGLLACARYDQAVLVPKEDETARRLCVLGLLASIGTGSVIAVAFYLAVPLGRSSWAELQAWSPLLGASVAITGLNAALTQWYVRTGQFKSVVRSRVAQSFCTIAVQLGGAAAGLGSIPLIAGDAIGRFAGLVALIGWAAPRTRIAALPKLDSLLPLAKSYRRFPLISTPSALVNAAGFSLPVILLERFYGTQAVGVFSLLERVMGIPTVLIGQPLSQLFSHSFRTALAENAAAAAVTIKQTAKTAAILGIIPFGALLAAGPQLFSLVLGPVWREAGTLAQVLALPYFCSYMTWPNMPALIILNQLHAQLIWDITRAGAMFALLSLIGLNGISANVAIGGAVSLMTIMYVVHFTVTLRATRRYEA